MKNKNVFKTVFDEKFNMNILKKQIINNNVNIFFSPSISKVPFIYANILIILSQKVL